MVVLQDELTARSLMLALTLEWHFPDFSRRDCLLLYTEIFNMGAVYLPVLLSVLHTL